MTMLKTLTALILLAASDVMSIPAGPTNKSTTVRAPVTAESPTGVYRYTGCVVERGGEEVLRYDCPKGPIPAEAIDALAAEVQRLHRAQAPSASGCVISSYPLNINPGISYPFSIDPGIIRP